MTKPEKKSNKPILLLHASPLSGKIYQDLLPLIGNDRIAVAADTPGYGMSDPPEAKPDIRTYAKAFSDLIDKLNFSSLDLVGYATGSIIAADLALLRPDKVRRLVLFSAPVLNSVDRKSLGNRFGHVIEAKADGTHLYDLWKQVYDGKGFDQTLEDCMMVFPEHIRAEESIKPWAPLAAFNYNLDVSLKKISQPIVVYNLNNEVNASTKRSAQFLNNGSLIELRDWGHGFLQNRTKETENLLRLFFDSKKPKTGP